MKKEKLPLLLILLVSVSFALCQRDEEIPLIDYSLTNIQTDPHYSRCTVTCRNKSVDGDKINLRLLLFTGENHDEVASTHVMQVDAGQLSCELTGLAGSTTYYFGFEFYTSRDSYRLEDIHSFTTTASSVRVDIAAVDSVTAKGGRCGGTVHRADRELAVQQCGVRWDTVPIVPANNNYINETTDQASMADSVFVSRMTSLRHSTTYYVRAYAITEEGVVYSADQRQFSTLAATNPTVRVDRVTDTNKTSAKVVGFVVDDGGDTVIERGVYYSPTKSVPDSNDLCCVATTPRGEGEFMCLLENLTADHDYAVRAYARSRSGFSYSTESLTFHTLVDQIYPPEVETQQATAMGSDNATLNGRVTNAHNRQIQNCGFCWTTDASVQTPTDTASMSHHSVGPHSAAFSYTLQGLSPVTTYYYWAYACSDAGLSFGIRKQFSTTSGSPTVVTATSAQSVTAHTATVGGTVTASGGANINQRGVYWGTDTNNFATALASGGGTGAFTVTLTGLQRSTTYYYRAFARNEGNHIGTGAVQQFTTLCEAPTLAAPVCSVNNTSGTVDVAASVQNNGGAPVIRWGVCWSTEANPDLSDAHHDVTPVTGSSFSYSIGNLMANVTYHVRAYAENSVGIAYSTDVTITTPSSFEDGRLTGLFTIGVGRQVRFAKGNLQYRATDNAFRFAPHQYDTVANSDNQNIGATCGAWIDLFGWGTSGHNNHYPYLHSTTASDYLPAGGGNISGTLYDWGTCAISGGGNTVNMGWRTLTREEWDTLISQRPGMLGVTQANTRFLATVAGVVGLVLIPDTWANTTSVSVQLTGSPNSLNPANTFTAAQWEQLEATGLVFLPMRGSRNGTTVYSRTASSGTNGGGRYWSSTFYSGSNAYYLKFSAGSAPTLNSDKEVYRGYAVRLVMDE